MCSTCGCGQPDQKILITKPEALSLNLNQISGKIFQPVGHHHHHHEENGHKPGLQTNKPDPTDKTILVEQDILHKNNLLAQRNRGYFEAKNMLALNLVSSPGSGKTSLLERTIKEMNQQFKLYVIEGDQQTMNDAERIKSAGAPVVQINTGTVCHLDAQMVHQAVKKLDPEPGTLLMIENVGNLVCPSLFDLGEAFRVIIMSVTEGEDKPLKYPYMFQSSHLCIINKTDLAPHVDFNMDRARSYTLQVNPELEIIELSCKTGQGFSQWYDWLKLKMPG